MTSSTANTLRTRFNSLTVSFFKKRLHLSARKKTLLIIITLWRFRNNYRMIVNSVFKERFRTVLQRFYRRTLNAIQSSFKWTFFTSLTMTDPLGSVVKYYQLLRCFNISFI